MPAQHAASLSPRAGPGRLASAALVLSASFVLSRLLGVLRNVLIADVFGNSRAIEAYFAAFRIPDTMYMLVSGGALASAFLPVFTGLLEEGDEGPAWKVASSVISSVFVILSAVAVIAFILAPVIMAVLVHGFTPAERDLTVHLTRIMLLQPIFLGVQAIVTSILQTYHRFTLTAVAPLVYNLFGIAGALLGRIYGVDALAWSIVVGALAYLVVQLPGLRPEASLRFMLDWSSAPAREVLRLLGPRIVGFAAFQVMLLITLYLAAGLPQGNVAAINYSWVIIWFPVSALGTAAATAIFPTLSRLSASEDLEAVARTVNRSLRLVLFLALPATVGLMVLRRPVVNLLYHRGEWTFYATEQTAFALLFYALAIPSLATIEVLPRVFYSMKDTLSPVRIAVVAVTLDAILSVALVHLLPPASGQGGLALATAIASTLQAGWLAVALETRLGSIGRAGLLLTLRDAGFASLAMGLVLYVSLDPVTAILSQTGLGVLITVAFEVLLGAAVFVAVAWAIGAPELRQVRSFVPFGK